MKIALVGYGKMGKAIEEIALERGHQIVAKVTSENPLESFDSSNFDAAIDFSTPSTVLKHINYLIDRDIPTVVGTTGWNDSLKEVTARVNNKNSALLHASNFSVGVNLFFKINEVLARLMTGREEYKAHMEEIHHTEKLDAPSGTAITLAEDIINVNPHYKYWNCPQGDEKKNTEDSIRIDALREPDVKGTHSIQYKSEIDTITIKHEAHNRKGFALGAVLAAEWIIGKKGVFTMKDVLNINA